MKIGNIIIVLLFIYPILDIDVEIDKENCFIIDDNILFGNNQVFYLDTSKVKYTQFYVHGLNSDVVYAKNYGLNKISLIVFARNLYITFRYTEGYIVPEKKDFPFSITRNAISRQFGMVRDNVIVVIEQLQNNQYYLHTSGPIYTVYYSYEQFTCINDNDYILYCCYIINSSIRCSVINFYLQEERITVIDITPTPGCELKVFPYDKLNKHFYLCVIVNNRYHQCWELNMNSLAFVTNKDDHIDFDSGGYTIEGQITNNFLILSNRNLTNIIENNQYVSTIKITNNYFSNSIPYRFEQTHRLYSVTPLKNLGGFIHYENYFSLELIYSLSNKIMFIPFYIDISLINVPKTFSGTGTIPLNLFYQFYTPSLKNDNGTAVYDRSYLFFVSIPSNTLLKAQSTQEVLTTNVPYYYGDYQTFLFQGDYSGTYTITYKLFFGTFYPFVITLNYICATNCIQCRNLECIICKDGFYLDNNKNCQPCKSQCKTCSSSTKCTSCAYPPYYFCEDNCVENCPAYYGTYNNNGVMTCTNCKSVNKYNLDGQCKDKTKGYYVTPGDQYNIYILCHFNCTACEDIDYNCQECRTNYFLFNDTRCFGECNGIKVGNNKCYNCIEDYAYFSNQGCIKCLDNPKYYQLDTEKEGNKCYNYIIDYHYTDNNRKLHPCDFRCSHCTINATHCDSCFPKYYLYRETCIDECIYFAYNMICYNCEGKEGFLLSQCEICESFDLYINVTSLSNECVELVDEYYADKNRYIHRCDAAMEGCYLCDSENYCTECKEGYFLYQHHCVVKCPLTLIEDKLRKECYSCMTDNMFLNYTSRTCIQYFSSGYYLYQDIDDNVLYPCVIDCSIELPGEGNSFCKDKNVYHKCYSKIKIDDEISLHYYPFSIDSQILNSFSGISSEEQKEFLVALENSIDFNSDNKTKVIEELFVLNTFAIRSNNEEEQLKYYEKTINAIRATLTCEKLFTIVGSDTRILIYISSLFVYQTVKANKQSDDEISLLSLIEKCLIEKAINEYNETKLIWMQNDFFEMSTKSTDKMLSSLETSNDINSGVLLLSDSRKNNKEVIEGISKMQTSFFSKDTQTYKNFEFITKSLEELNNKFYIHNNILISTSSCNDNNIVLRQLKDYNLSTKICVPYENIRQRYPQVEYVSMIYYNYYPLLNKNSFIKVNKEFNALILRDHNNTAVNIKKLTEPIVLILKKPYPSFNECIFYDETEEEFNNTDCNSTEISVEYIKCSCYHLTDFSLSKYNPVELAKDIIRLFQQARFINSFKQFKYLNASNATVLYVISSIVLVYSVLLIFAIMHDRKEGDSQFVLIVEKEEKCCERKDNTEEELKELDTKIRKYNNRRQSQVIEMKTISGNNTQANKESIIPKKTNSSASCSLIYTYLLLLKEFFTKEYWFCTFINSENEMSKVNILTVFFIRLVVSLSICSLFTECSAVEDSNEDLYNNRDLAVSVATILIMELPFTFFEVMLNKTKISPKYITLKKRVIVNTKYRHALVYILFILMLMFGTVNTLWISLDSYINDYECNFLTDFFISTIFDCFIFQIVTLLLKSMIYIVIIKGRKNNCVRGCLICVVSSLPWIFNL